jgi:hypothetical protein
MVTSGIAFPHVKPPVVPTELPALSHGFSVAIDAGGGGPSELCLANPLQQWLIA